jgi:hypothetical protein
VPEQVSLILQGTTESSVTAYSVLANAARTEAYERAIFIAPFMTEQGVQMLNEVARLAGSEALLWIVGLDGAITSPQALAALTSFVPHAEQFGWCQDREYPTLHAKVYILRHVQPRKTVLYVGSANATYPGLSENIEAGILRVATGQDSSNVDLEMDTWIESLRKSPCCIELTTTEKERYSRHYHPVRGRGKKVSHVVGGEERPRSSAVPQGEKTWIEVAVRGGSANQIEICKDMATFFTRGQSVERVDFELVDAATGIGFANNSYRFRHRNVGYRVEVNTDLAKTLDLQAAAGRRDIVLFERTHSPSVYIISLYPARSQERQHLIDVGEQEGRVRSTTKAPGGRLYYL